MIVLAAIGAALFTACAGDKLTIKNVKMVSTLKEGSGGPNRSTNPDVRRNKIFFFFFFFFFFLSLMTNLSVFVCFFRSNQFGQVIFDYF
jgi:hypothetical protein